MRILIVVPTAIEVQPLLDELSIASNPVVGELIALELAPHANLEVRLLISGIGMMSTAFYMGQLIAIQQFDLVLHIGIAGSAHDSLKAGQIVHVSSQFIADIGAEDPRFDEGFQPMYQMSIVDDEAYPLTRGRYINTTLVSMPVPLIQDIPQVRGISINTISGSQKTLDRYSILYPFEVETMEGAAVHHACLAKHIKYFEIRSISNKAADRDKSNWHLSLAVDQLHDYLKLLLDYFNNNLAS